MKGSHEVGRVCDENWQVVCEEEEVRERWKEYFASLSPTSDQTQQGGWMEVPRQFAETVQKIALEEV